MIDRLNFKIEYILNDILFFKLNLNDKFEDLTFIILRREFLI